MSEDHEVDALLRRLAAQIGVEGDQFKTLQGTVVSMEGPTCSLITSDTTEVSDGWTWLRDSYYPIVGDVVWILDGGPGAKIIIGTTSRDDQWQDAALLNGWLPFAAPQNLAGWRVHNGHLELCGTIARATAPGYPSTIFNIAEAWAHPTFTAIRPIFINGGIGTVSVNGATGDVSIATATGANPHLATQLDGVSIPLLQNNP
jgi:hypothetical protein